MITNPLLRLKDLGQSLWLDYVQRQLLSSGELARMIAVDGLARLNAGIALPGRAPGAVKVSWQNETRLRIAAKALKTGHVTLMCEAVGLQVTAMRRIRIGRMSMASLAAGNWRFLAG